MKQLWFNPLLLIALAICSGLFSGSTAQAEETTRIYLQPVSAADQTVTVNVMVDHVDNLYGAEVTLVYNPAELSVTDANPEQEGVQITGGQLLPPEQGFVVVNKADPATGIITFAMTLLNPAPPVSGSGALAQIVFTRLPHAPSTIDFTNATLVAVNMQTIPAQLSPLTIDPNTAAVTASADGGFPWWIVAAGIIVLGMAALGGLMYLGSFKAAPTPQVSGG
jgi:hypothetical protein